MNKVKEFLYSLSSADIRALVKEDYEICMKVLPFHKTSDLMKSVLIHEPSFYGDKIRRVSTEIREEALRRIRKDTL
jgi:hypothetical protein